MELFILEIPQKKQSFKEYTFILTNKLFFMKTLEEFVELFAEQFDETDPSVFTPETRFRDIDEWSSLIGLSLIAMVDEEFDVTLKGDDVKNANTVKELYDTVISKL